MDAVLPAVLLVGGGEGMGPGQETARALSEELYARHRRRPTGQVMVIYGRNLARVTKNIFLFKSLDELFQKGREAVDFPALQELMEKRHRWSGKIMHCPVRMFCYRPKDLKLAPIEGCLL